MDMGVRNAAGRRTLNIVHLPTCSRTGRRPTHAFNEGGHDQCKTPVAKGLAEGGPTIEAISD